MNLPIFETVILHKAGKAAVLNYSSHQSPNCWELQAAFMRDQRKGQKEFFQSVFQVSRGLSSQLLHLNSIKFFVRKFWMHLESFLNGPEKKHSKFVFIFIIAACRTLRFSTRNFASMITMFVLQVLDDPAEDNLHMGMQTVFSLTGFLPSLSALWLWAHMPPTSVHINYS